MNAGIWFRQIMRCITNTYRLYLLEYVILVLTNIAVCDKFPIKPQVPDMGNRKSEGVSGSPSSKDWGLASACNPPLTGPLGAT